MPQRPGAWLTTTARNRALDRLRRRAAETARLRTFAATASEDDGPAPATARRTRCRTTASS